MHAATVTHRQVLAFLWRYMRRHGGLLGVILLLLVLSALLGLTQPFFYKEAVDAIAKSEDPSLETFRFAVTMVLMGVLFGALHIAMSEVSFYLLAWMETRVMRGAWSDVFARVQRLSTRFHVNAFAGATARKIGRGVDALENMMDLLWLNFLPLAINVIGFAVVLLFYAPMIAILIILCTAIYIPLSIWMNLIVARLQGEADEQDSHAMANMVDAVTANATVKAYGAERREEERHNAEVLAWQQKTWRSWNLGNIFGLVQSQFMILIECLLLLLAVFLWYRGSFTAGGFIVVVFYVGRLWGYVRDVGRNARNYLKAATHAQEMVELASMPIDVEDTPGAPPLVVREGGIRFDRITFRYGDATKPVFQNFSLRIRPGEKIALVGHSGGGKSTFVKLLLRLYDLQAGSIVIDGQDIAQVAQESLRCAIALVPQDPILFHRSIAENIAYAKPEATRQEIERVAHLAHAHEFIAKLPKKYDTLVGERGVKLSGGERQRVAIARAILADTPILILDEATSSLDSLSEKYIQEALATLMEGRTTIAIAHRLSTIKRADRILVIEDGKIIEEGSHAELFAKEGGLYRHFFELQAGGFLGE